MNASPSRRRPSPTPDSSVRSLAAPMFGLLAIEFVLGSALALFVTLPNAGGVVTVLESSTVLDLHIAVALLIVGISARAIVLAFRQGDRVGRFASTLALTSALLATAAGWDFAFDGQAPGASFVMAIGFLGVLVGAFLLRAPSSGPVPGDAPPTRAAASERPGGVP
jgi:hypothetical protein